MTNTDKYIQAFVDSLQIEESELAGLKYQENPEWDSVGHLSLISELEDVFDIDLSTEDVINLSTYEKGKEILSSKYNIKF